MTVTTRRTEWTADQIKVIHFLESLVLSDHLGEAFEAAHELAEAFGINVERRNYDESDCRRFVKESGVARYFKAGDDAEDE